MRRAGVILLAALSLAACKDVAQSVRERFEPVCRGKWEGALEWRYDVVKISTGRAMGICKVNWEGKWVPDSHVVFKRPEQ